MNELDRFRDCFRDLDAWAGTPPRGFYADWLGSLTDASFRAYTGLKAKDVGGEPVETRLPAISDGEGWFEAVSQVEAAREARGRFVMISLGACYGAQAVGSWLALQRLNPMPAKLVTVEPEPDNLAWIARHFRDNGLDPDNHWLIGAAISDSNAPVLFPVGSPGSGTQNAVVTNEDRSRKAYVKRLTGSGTRAKRALRSLLLHNRLGLERNLITGIEADPESDILSAAVHRARVVFSRIRRGEARAVSRADQSVASNFEFDAGIQLLSAVTLKDVLGPFDRVDYLEADIQQSEAIVFPPFMDELKRKVRRVHIGTHGSAVHEKLADLFRARDWSIIFDYPPHAHVESEAGAFTLNDGVLCALNPALA